MYNYGLKFLPGGLGTLMTSTIPIFITLFTGLWLKKKILPVIIWCLVLCFVGVCIAAWPLIQFTKESVFGIMILLIGIISNAAAAVYFVGTNWDGINLLTINAWQTLIGTLFLLPICLYNYDSRLNHFTFPAIVSVGWLAIFISIIAILLSLFILKQIQYGRLSGFSYVQL